MQAWQAGFQTANPDATINYDPVGSGGGREQFIDGHVAFAGSDSALDDEEVAGGDRALRRRDRDPGLRQPDRGDLQPRGRRRRSTSRPRRSPASSTRRSPPGTTRRSPRTTRTPTSRRRDHAGQPLGRVRHDRATSPSTSPPSRRDAWPHEPDGDWPVVRRRGGQRHVRRRRGRQRRRGHDRLRRRQPGRSTSASPTSWSARSTSRRAPRPPRRSSTRRRASRVAVTSTSRSSSTARAPRRASTRSCSSPTCSPAPRTTRSRSTCQGLPELRRERRGPGGGRDERWVRPDLGHAARRGRDRDRGHRCRWMTCPVSGLGNPLPRPDTGSDAIGSVRKTSRRTDSQ